MQRGWYRHFLIPECGVYKSWYKFTVIGQNIKKMMFGWKIVEHGDFRTEQ